MTVGLSLAHLLLPQASVSDILDEITALSPPVLEVAAGGPEPLQRALAAGIARLHLPICAVEAFFPGPRPLAGPALSAPDAAERQAAVRLTERSIYAAAEFGARLVVVALGDVAFDAEGPLLRQAFERAEPPVRLIRRKREERASAAAPHLDAARLALEELLRVAEAATVELALCNRPSYEQLPDADEIGVLLNDFRGAPLGTWFDTAAAKVQETLGTAPSEAALRSFGRDALGVHLTDATGLTRGLAPGIGEIDFALLKDRIPAAAPRFVHCAPGASAREVREALTAMQLLLG
jgi:sugar phosphate isomerase/epimerase